ncbi:putative polygalacturonase At1g80170 [Curcuma longa]|uniref:putative polygalacturonase At1g80170 n=1 Tax=Curcuma longa TaxID=136217 RepID=UPI003D9E09C8
MAKAFLRAWDDVCADRDNPTLLIPSGATFLIKKLIFQGNCNSRVTVRIDGDIVAPEWFWTDEYVSLMAFHNVNSLTVDGDGQIDGKGKIWWDCFSRKIMSFAFCNDLTLRGIALRDSPSKHLTFFASARISMSGLRISAPGDSPNTDGMLIAQCKHVVVSNSAIGVGDDCVAVGTNTTNVTVTNVQCGPGHGFSIGSLGGDSSPVTVKRVHFLNSTLTNTTVGVRIKTWMSGGTGRVRNVLFENINFTSVRKPIQIDQYYCPARNCRNKTSSLTIENVEFAHLQGSSSDELATELLCSRYYPCRGIVMRDVHFQWNGVAPAKSACFNVLTSKFYGRVLPSLNCVAG